MWSLFRRSRRPEQPDVDDSGAARERAEHEKAKQRILDLAHRYPDGPTTDRWNGPTVIIPRDQPLLTRGGEHRAQQPGWPQ